MVRVLAVALAGMVILAGAQFVELTLLRPHGEWDAWAIWNGRAAFLSSLAGDWPGAALQINRGHGDYPLLLSLSVARFWAYLGAPSPLAPQALALLYLGSLVALLVSALSVFRSRSQGLLAGIVLLAAPPIVEIAAYQQADLPLAFHLLATCVLLVGSSHAAGRERSRLLAAAGLALGLAAWTKNEGLALALAAPCAYLFASFARDRRVAARELGALLAGMLPMATVIALFKAGLAPESDLVTSFRL